MNAKILPIKNLTRRPLRTAALVIIAVFLTAAVFGGAAVIKSLQNGLEGLEQRLGADIVVVPESAEAKVDLENILLQGTPGYFYMDKEIAQKLGDLEGVEKISGQYFLVSANAECCTVQVQIIGFDDKTDFTVKPWLNKSYSGNLKKNEIIVGSSLATRVGHSLKLYGVECRAVGKLEPTGTGLDTAVYTSNETVSGLIDAAAEQGIQVLSKQRPEDMISSVYIKASKGTDIAELASRIDLGIDGVQAVRTKPMITGTADRLDTISGSVSFIIIALWVLAAVIMTVVFSAVANERKREFAVLRVIGFSRKMLSSILMKEAAIVAITGFVIGAGITALIIYPFGGLIESRTGLPFITPDAGQAAGFLALALLSVMLTGPLAAGIAAMRLSRIDTAKILREGN